MSIAGLPLRRKSSGASARSEASWFARAATWLASICAGVSKGSRGTDTTIEHTVIITEEGLVKLAAAVPEGMMFVPPSPAEASWSWTHQLGLLSGPLGSQPTRWVSPDQLAVVGTRVLDSILSPLRLPAFYLPADRAGIMHAHRVVVGALIENATMAGIRRTDPTPTLSGVLADFLQQLIKMDERSFGSILQSTFQRSLGLLDPPISQPDLGRSIEKEILQGAVRIEKEGTGYPSFRFRPSEWESDLPLMRVSSMVAELAPLVLYLRHVVASNNVLIVEEPESHLHPAKQVELVGQLARIVHAGIRVIVTTHSEWVLDELANLVNLSKLSQEESGGIANSETALSPDQVGAWLFAPRGDRRRVGRNREVPLDETGYARTGFDEVAIALHNRFATISDRIEASE